MWWRIRILPLEVIVYIYFHNYSWVMRVEKYSEKRKGGLRELAKYSRILAEG